MIDPKNYRPMTCPVCGKFEFTELQETDLLIRDYMQCFSCGWKYDHKQINHPDLAEGLNTLSLNDYKAWHQEQIETDPEYNWLDANYQPTPHRCPICQQTQFEDEGGFEVCPHCGWCDDGLMEREPDKWEGCANDLCFNDYKARYEHLCKAIPNYDFSEHGTGDE